MKQLIFMVLLTLIGTGGTVFVNPTLGVFIYYLFAVLRPQYLWQWVLPPGIAWSWYVAAVTIAVAALKLPELGSDDRQAPRFTRGHGVVLAFAFWVVVTFLGARDREVAWPCLIEYSKIFVMFAAATLLLRSLRDLWILYVLTALALGYIAFEVNHLYFTSGALAIWHNGYGGLDNNGAGLMLAMGIPLCYFAWEGTPGRWRWVFFALLPVLVHAVLMTYSRGAMLSLLVASPLVLLRSQRRKQLFVFGLLFLLSLPVMAGPQIQARFLTLRSTEQDESAQSRRGSWAAAWTIALDNPITGVGPRNANLLSHTYGADIEGRTIHSQFLQIAADNGLVGLGLYLAAPVVIATGLARMRRGKAAQTGPDAVRVRALAAGIECSLLVFYFGALFLSLEVFELPYLMLLLGAQLPHVAEGARRSMRLALQPRRFGRGAVA